MCNAGFKPPFPSQRKEKSLELQTAFIASKLRYIANTPPFLMLALLHDMARYVKFSEIIWCLKVFDDSCSQLLLPSSRCFSLYASDFFLMFNPGLVYPPLPSVSSSLPVLYILGPPLSQREILRINGSDRCFPCRHRASFVMVYELLKCSVECLQTN